MKILVVDDEALLVKGIRFNLKSEGYDVITGSNGQEAVEMAKALPKQFSQPVVDAYASATADLVSRYESLRSDAASNDAYLREYLGQD